MDLVLTSRNFSLFAARNYRNPHCLDVEEFEEDLSRFKYVRKLLTRFRDSGDLQERLILNHLTIIYNVFDAEAATAMLFARVDPQLLGALKAFLVHLNKIPHGLLANISVDDDVASKLLAL